MIRNVGILIIACMACIAPLMVAALMIDFRPESSHNLRDYARALEVENGNLKTELRRAEWYRNQWIAYDSTWATLKRHGWQPDRGIVFGLLRECEKWKIDRTMAVEWSCKESSLFRNLFGAAGEVGGFQMMPKTLRAILIQAGADTTGFKPEQYEMPGDNIPMAMYTLKFLAVQNPSIKYNHERDWRRMHTFSKVEE